MKKEKPNLVGQTFGEWTVIRDDGDKKVECKCTCGEIKMVSRDNLVGDKSHGCRGCLKRSKHKKKMLGATSGRLTIIGFTEGKDYDYICRCECGNIVNVDKGCFRDGVTRSCGCLKRDLIREKQTRKLEIGKTYGHITVLERLYHDDGNPPTWKVRCELCGREYISNGRTIGKGSGMCLNCSKKGERNPAWDDTITDEERQKRRKWECSNEIQEWRKSVFERENYTCEKCGKRGVRLNAHHKNGYKWCVNERTNVDNGACLCKECHKKFHSKYGLKYNTEEQYIAFLIEDFDNIENEN